MLQLRCTKKVLDHFRISDPALAEPQSTDAALGNWYVNLVKIDRRNTLIFMSERTLLSFVLFGVRKSNSTKLAEIFIHGAMQLLQLEGFTESEIASALGGDGILTVTKTDNRKALGNLNDLMRIYEHSVWYEHGFKHCDLWGIISSTNRMPQKNIGGGYSIDLARELVQSPAISTQQSNEPDT